MRSYIIKGFLPWILFFAFVDGTVLGLKFAVYAALISLIVFSRKSLKQKFILDWVSLIFFVFLLILGVGLLNPFVIHYGLFLANIMLAVTCLGSLVINEPFSLQYARINLSKSYHHNPILIGVNRWITFVWGFCFLISSISIGFYYFGHPQHFLVTNSMLWLVKIIPTGSLVIALFFTILFPDLYKKRKMKKGGVAEISGISEIKLLSLGNVTIAYRILGKGPLLILLSGSQMNMHYWDPELLKKLSEHYQVLIFDYPGVGRSSYENMPYTAEKIATCLKRFIEKLELKPKAIIGYSLGGKIAQVFANHYNDQLETLVLINTDFGGSEVVQCSKEVAQVMSAQVQAFAEKGVQMLSLLFPESCIERMHDKLQKIILAASLEGVVTQEMIEKEHELSERFAQDETNSLALKELSLPTLIIVGSQDELIPAENSERLHKMIKGSKLIAYEDAKHGVIYQYPYDIADNIHDFLSAL